LQSISLFDVGPEEKNFIARRIIYSEYVTFYYQHLKDAISLQEDCIFLTLQNLNNFPFNSNISNIQIVFSHFVVFFPTLHGPLYIQWNFKTHKYEMYLFNDFKCV